MSGQSESLQPSELFKYRMVISHAIFEFLLGPDSRFNSHVISHFLFITTLSYKYNYLPLHFTVEQTETQRGEMIL